MSKQIALSVRAKDAINVLLGRDNNINKSMAANLLSDGYNRPYNYNQYTDYRDIYKPREKLSFRRRDQLFDDSAILRSVITKLTQEISRNGIEVKPIFIRKCMRAYIEPCPNIQHALRQVTNQDPKTEGCLHCSRTSTPELTPDLPMGQDECGEEYETNQKICVECKAPTRPPKVAHKRKLRKFKRKYINANAQKLTQVLSQLEIDIEKHDTAFFITQYIYTYEDSRLLRPTDKVPINIYRGNPALIRPVISRTTGGLGSDYYTCLYHRKVYEQHNPYELNGEHPRCPHKFDEYGPECGQPMQITKYVQLTDERNEENVEFAYIDGEVHQMRKYNPATPMGTSLIDSNYYIILQLVGQEKWIAEYYLKMRMFKGYLDIPNEMGGTAEDIKTLVGAEFRKFREDPYYVPILTRPTKSDKISFVRIDDSPKELQFLENRQEARTQVANAYGVSNVWMNDNSAGAGLNNEGMGIVITNRAIEYGQSILEEQGLMPLCASILNIELEDLEYYIGFNPHEEQDQMAEKQRKTLDIANAAAHQALGGTVTQTPEGDYILSSPVEGMPLMPPGQQSIHGDARQDVQGMSGEGLQYERRSASLPMQGSPSLPNAQGSNLRNKTRIMKVQTFAFLRDNIYWEKGDPTQFFDIIRNNDETGTSGTGKVISGIVFEDGTTVVRWMTKTPSVSIFGSFMDFYEVHIGAHPGNNTEIIWNTTPDVIFKTEVGFEQKHPRSGGGEFSTTRGAKDDSNEEEETEEESDEEESEPYDPETGEGELPTPKKLGDDDPGKHTRYYTAQSGYKSGSHINQIDSEGGKQTIGMDMVKSMFPSMHKKMGELKMPRPDQFANSNEFNNAKDAYQSQMFRNFRNMGAAIYGKFKSQLGNLVTPIPTNGNEDLWYAGTMSDLGDILSSGKIGEDKLFVTTDMKNALKHGDVALKFRGKGNMYVDPDPFTGQYKEGDVPQYIKEFEVPLKNVTEAWIHADSLNNDLRDRLQSYQKGDFIVLDKNLLGSL